MDYSLGILFRFTLIFHTNNQNQSENNKKKPQFESSDFSPFNSILLEVLIIIAFVNSSIFHNTNKR